MVWLQLPLIANWGIRSFTNIFKDQTVHPILLSTCRSVNQINCQLRKNIQSHLTQIPITHICSNIITIGQVAAALQCSAHQFCLLPGHPSPLRWNFGNLVFFVFSRDNPQYLVSFLFSQDIFNILSGLSGCWALPARYHCSMYWPRAKPDNCSKASEYSLDFMRS